MRESARGEQLRNATRIATLRIASRRARTQIAMDPRHRKLKRVILLYGGLDFAKLTDKEVSCRPNAVEIRASHDFKELFAARCMMHLRKTGFSARTRATREPSIPQTTISSATLYMS